MGDQKSLVEKIRDDVLKTGFPTEVATASKLEAAGWKTTLGLSYMDEHTHQSREFDIRAYQEISERYPREKSYSFGVYLMIERKKSQKPWVIFTSPNEHEARFGPYQGKFIHSPSTDDGILNPTLGRQAPLLSDGLLISYHHYFQPKRWGHNYYEAFRNREQAERSTQIYTAITSVINATRFYIREFRPMGPLKPLVYPVIVVDGDLFEAVVGADGDVMITPSEHLILKYHMIPPGTPFDFGQGFNGANYLIDIVRSSHVEEYARNRAQEHERLIAEVNRAASFAGEAS